MLLKGKEPRTGDIAELNRLLSLPLNPRQKSLVEQELRALQAGEKKEEDAAYFLDFHLKDSKNWVVIHDLRIEHRGKVAQIDHLVFGRFLYMFVLESKSFSYGIKITPEGEFLRWNGKAYQGIESPLEQNNRHIFALEQAIKDRGLAPKRLRLPIPITYKNVVLISPKSTIIRPDGGTDDGTVLKADAFWTHAQREVDKISILEAGKLISSESLKEFGERLVRLHRSAGRMNYLAKFGISTDLMEPPALINVVASPSTPVPATAAVAVGRACDDCGVEVESKVVAFCRFNKAKFDGKTLCRECQQKIGSNFGGKNVKVQSAKQAIAAVSSSVPTCPACNAVMVKRQAKKGPNAGGWFWACTAYPKCRKALAVEAV